MKGQSSMNLWSIHIVQAITLGMETISQLNFTQIEASFYLEMKAVLGQVAYELEARGVKSLKI